MIRLTLPETVKTLGLEIREWDVYDDEVVRLMDAPELILVAWGNAEPLFRFASPGGRSCERDKSGMHSCGCLTMVRSSGRAYTPEMTLAIQQDSRIPLSHGGITPANLPVFAEWQRRIDGELNRTPPEPVT